MTRIDFYVLKDVDREARFRFACALTAKAVEAGNRVFLRTSNEEDALLADDYLWSWPPHRFIPHTLGPNSPGKAAHPAIPVLIHTEPPKQCEGLMINLGDDVPDFYGRFDRIAEIIVGCNRDSGRERYRRYRHRGNPLFHHELDDWESGV